MHPNLRMWSLKPRWVDWVALTTVLLIAGMLMSLSLMRYTGYNVGMLDLGNMAQAIWSGTQGHPLEFTYQRSNLSRLALHVELIYWLFVPLYLVFPDPRTLLVSQALLFAAGAWPVYRLAMRRLKQRSLARGLVLLYLLYPVAQTAVLFDFHGDTLAMPLLLFAFEALDRKTWRSYAFWIGLALSCKFYVAVAVVVLGVVLWLRGQRWVGGLTVLGAVLWLAITLVVIRPAFAPPMAAQSHVTFTSYLEFYFGGIGSSFLNTAVQRILTGVVVFTSGIWLGRYAWRWTLPAFAVAVPAMFSLGDVAAYDYRFHHYAVTVPFLIVATVYGTDELRQRQERVSEDGNSQKRPWRGEVFLTVAIALIFNVGLVDTPLNPQFWLGKPTWGLSEWKYGHTQRDAFKDGWLGQHVPARAPLVASGFLAPHLTNRRTLFLVRSGDELRTLGQPDHRSQTEYLMRHPEALHSLLLSSHLEEVQYVVADALNDFAKPFGEGLLKGGALYDVPGIALALQHPEFGLLLAQDGLLLFRRDIGPEEALKQTYKLRTWDNSSSAMQFRFGELIGLLSARIDSVGDRRFRLRFEWTTVQPLDEMPPLFAVSRLEGVDHSRIVHLPTQTLYPTPLWQPGQVVEEDFDVVLPADIPAGSYRLLTGWYDGSNAYAAATDDRSRIGEEVQVATIAVRGESIEAWKHHE